MPRPPRLHAPGTIYHVMARGNDGQAIFHERLDWSDGLKIIAEVRRTIPFELFAYCLMTNHIHLLIRVARTPLSTIMQRLLNSWVRKFNWRSGRQGHLFQARFKAIVCRDDAYFKTLLRYVHLNPVHAGLVSLPQDWEWSSYQEYLNPLQEGLSDRGWPLSHFASTRQSAIETFRDFVLRGIEEDRAFDPFSEESSGQETIPVNESLERDRPALAALTAEAAMRGGVALDLLTGKTRLRTVCAARRDFVLRAVQAGYNLTEVAATLAVSPSAVSQMLRWTPRDPFPSKT